MAKKITITVLDKNDEILNHMDWEDRNGAKAFMFDLLMEGQKTGQYEVFQTRRKDHYIVWNYEA